eukprot:NODE_740_length_2136_cov_110.410333_g706_i0.p1 GENE.NODE_740_length_2136_cov_110.410333_g706_i0~~NODE_740_length_2136_cov_110.410333_g706_i0.p1  ORF type:complete len:661 (-),score=127.74 NODE_740_length_2136_cov_110.410333_g706_i0:154-2082(-)
MPTALCTECGESFDTDTPRHLCNPGAKRQNVGKDVFSTTDTMQFNIGQAPPSPAKRSNMADMEVRDITNTATFALGALGVPMQADPPRPRSPFQPNARPVAPTARIRELVVRIIHAMMAHAVESSGSFNEVFNKMDTNRDGVLCAEELLQGLRNFGISIEPAEVVELAKGADADNNGALDAIEFVRWLASMNDALQQEFHEKVLAVAKQSPNRNRPCKKRPLMPDSNGHNLMRSIVFEIMAKAEKVENIFRAMDINADGSITCEELASGLHRIFGVSATAASLQALGDTYDVNSDGTLDPWEFVAMLKDMNGYLQDRFWWHVQGTQSPLEYIMYRLIFKIASSDYNLVDIFAKFDQNKDGLLSVDEFTTSLREIGLDATGQEAAMLIKTFDQQNKGVLNTNDFISMVVKINTEMQRVFHANVITPANVDIRVPSIPMAPNTREREIIQQIVYQAMRVNRNLVDVFRTFDKDGTHSLSPTEFADGVVAFGVPCTVPEMEALIRSADANSDGQIDVQEFVSMILNMNKYLQNRLHWCVMNVEQRRNLVILKLVKRIEQIGGGFKVVNIFRAIDVNGDHALTLPEFADGLAKLGVFVPAGEARLLFSTWDKDGDGSMSLEEFCVFLEASVANVKDMHDSLNGMEF